MKRCLLYGCLFIAVWFGGGALAQATALDDYIKKADPMYAYRHYSTDSGLLKPYTAYFLHMTSQQWRSADQVKRPLREDGSLWEHVVQITVPKLRHSNSPNTAILLVTGGDNPADYPTKTDDRVAAVAVALGSVVAIVSQIPNQPLFFADEVNVARSDDGIIAYSFDKFLKTGDDKWPALLPMTKAVVRAMDTVQAYLVDHESIRIDNFIVLGGSKHGWTTWLTAAVDPRVKALAPASIDLLSMQEQFRRQFEAYGFYAPAIADYAAFDLPNRLATPGGQALLGIVDPYSYRDRYTMPKIIPNSTGDQFFLPDSSRFYYAGLSEPKWLRYAPNTDHKQSLDVVTSLASWIDQINDRETPHRYSWTVEPDGAILVQALDLPDRVRLWQATNPNARDFRLETIGPVWTSTDLQPVGSGVYRGYVPPPSRGWTAYMVELTYEESGVLEPNQVFTTDVVVTPDILPFAGVKPKPIGNDLLIDLGTPYGLWLYQNDRSWLAVHNLSVRQMASGDLDNDGRSDVLIDFGPPYGIWARRNGESWSPIHGASAQQMIASDLDNNGRTDFVVNFGPSAGLWVYMNDSSWKHLHVLAPRQVISANLDADPRRDLVIDFGPPYGIWLWMNDTNWVALHAASARDMVAGDLDGNGGIDEIVIDFGSPYGIWARFNQQSWAPLNGTSSRHMAVGTFDSNPRKDVIIDFGPPYGIWKWSNNSAWSQIHSSSAQALAVADMDKNGIDDLAVSFGDPYGLWVLRNGNSWQSLHYASPPRLISTDFDGQ